jgi:metal-responsive CopG/Arc/MetJ family transcriptional regulator
MSSAVAKVAVSLPKELFNSMEQARRKLKLPRSAAVVEALRAWLKRQEEEKLVRQYTEGYRRHPESRLEVREGSRHAAREFGKDPW